MSKPTPLSERQLVDRIRARYEGDSGNGPAGCVVPQVRNQAGFDANRTIDALGFHFWPSRGLLIDAFEARERFDEHQAGAPRRPDRARQRAGRPAAARTTTARGPLTAALEGER